ncbi:MAG: hypothetical protein JJV94_04790 [Sulfurospirillum sp.]|nr:hypothetical protein [Sulfurospirillum sp.]
MSFVFFRIISSKSIKPKSIRAFICEEYACRNAPLCSNAPFRCSKFTSYVISLFANNSFRVIFSFIFLSFIRFVSAKNEINLVEKLFRIFGAI